MSSPKFHVLVREFGLKNGHQSKLRGLELKGWFGGLPSIGNQTRQEIDEEILEAAMARVFDLGDVLKLIVDTLDQGTFAQEEPIYQRQQAWFHVAPEGRD